MPFTGNIVVGILGISIKSAKITHCLIKIIMIAFELFISAVNKKYHQFVKRDKIIEIKLKLLNIKTVDNVQIDNLINLGQLKT